GTTTALIAQRCKDVLGTDISEKVIERAREQHPDLRFAAFDVLAASRLGEFSKVYIDMSGLSGYRSLLDVIALLNMYATVLRPDAIVVKSGALKHFASHSIAWQSPPSGGADADDEDDE
ncbi:MAG: class I SAM-dependent methyltransferase, partial [Streptosporangiaceae bacterium]